MGKIRKITSVILAFVLVLVIFTGCKKKEDQKNTFGVTKSSSAKVTSTKKVTKTTAPKKTALGTLSIISTGENNNENENVSDKENDNQDHNSADDENIREYFYDFKGRTIVLKEAHTNLAAIVSDDPIGYVPGISETDDYNYQLEKDMEEKYNCKIMHDNTMNNAQLIRQQLNLDVLSGIPSFDLLGGNGLWINPLFASLKIFAPLEEYLDFDSDPKLNDPLVRAMATSMGKKYTIPNNIPYNINDFLFYNRSIIKVEGLEDPQELCMNGQWNWEMFRNMLIACTHDIDGDSITDQYGMANPTNIYFMRGMLNANKAVIVGTDGSNYKFMMDQPEALRVLNYTSDLFNIDKVISPMNNTFVIGKALFDGGNWAGAGKWNYGQKGIDYGYVMMPNGPDNPDGSITPVGSGSGYFINAYANEIKGLAYLLYDLSTTYVDPNRFISITQFMTDFCTKYNLNADYALEYIMNRPINTINLEANSLSFEACNKFANQVYNNIIKPHIPPVTHVEENKAALQEEIDAIVLR